MEKLFFGKNIKYLLDEIGKNQSWLANQLGVSKSMISDYLKKGKIPTIQRAIKIRNIFNVNLEDLFFKNLELEKSGSFYPAVQIGKSYSKENKSSKNDDRLDSITELKKEVYNLRVEIEEIKRKE